MCEGERDLNLCDILKFLNVVQIRATYGAVAEVLGDRLARGPWRDLGTPRPYTSWIVRKRDGLPSGYTKEQYHPCLFRTDKVICVIEKI